LAKIKKIREFRGIAVSPGIAIGQVHLIEVEPIDIPKFWISDREIPAEISRFRAAVKKAQKELLRIRERLCKFQIGDQVKIIDSHQMIAQDETLLKNTQDAVRNEKINAEWAFQKELEKMIESSPRDGNDYFRERYNELHHVARRILLYLMGPVSPSPKQFRKDSVIVAHDLSPADTVQMVKGLVHGFLTEGGGPTSHTAIVARAMEIPAVCGIDGVTHAVQEGDTILVDGNEGRVILNPTKRELSQYEDQQKAARRLERQLLREAHLPSITKDGYTMHIAANMELIDEIPTIKSHGAEGVGLFRTEIFFISGQRLPTEEEQFKNYSEVLKKMAPHSTTIRTLDIGGDKLLADQEYIDNTNPALGLRAIRYCLKERHLLKTQLRAMLRASRYGPLKILIPMVTNLEEIRQVKKIIADIEEDLKKEKSFFDPNIKLGAMIETPSAAIMADEIASETDFLSIGTNDLIQYTLAVDRVNEEVSYLYEPLHPAVLRLLKITCDAARSRNVGVSLCGEMAGDPLCFLLLLGLGLTELSMNAVSIPRVKKLTRSVTFRQANELLDRALNSKTATEVEHLVRREAAKIEGFPKI